MSIGLIILIVIAVIIIGSIVWGIKVNNNIITHQTDTDQSWHQIDVQLQRRNNLIPNLVSTVKGYANFESNTLARVIKYRGQMVHISADDNNSLTRQQIMNVSNQLSGAMKSLFAVSERYPQLQANSDFKELMSQLETTEDKIAYARQLYNKSVATYNNNIRLFPDSIIANMRNFTKRDYLHVDPSVRHTPKVDFSDLSSNQGNSSQSNQSN